MIKIANQYPILKKKAKINTLFMTKTTKMTAHTNIAHIRDLSFLLSRYNSMPNDQCLGSIESTEKRLTN